MTDEELERKAAELHPKGYEVWREIAHLVKEGESSFLDFDMYFGEPPEGVTLVEKDQEQGPFPLSHWRWQMALPPADSAEMRYWLAIQSALRVDERSFEAFLWALGTRPAGMELREIPGRRRPGFKLAHFEWMPMSAPRAKPEPNKTLRGVQEELRRAELEKLVEAKSPEVEIPRPKVKVPIFPTE